RAPACAEAQVLSQLRPSNLPAYVPPSPVGGRSAVYRCGRLRAQTRAAIARHPAGRIPRPSSCPAFSGVPLSGASALKRSTAARRLAPIGVRIQRSTFLRTRKEHGIPAEVIRPTYVLWQ